MKRIVLLSLIIYLCACGATTQIYNSNQGLLVQDYQMKPRPLEVILIDDSSIYVKYAEFTDKHLRGMYKRKPIKIRYDQIKEVYKPGLGSVTVDKPNREGRKQSAMHPRSLINNTWFIGGLFALIILI